MEVTDWANFSEKHQHALPLHDLAGGLESRRDFIWTVKHVYDVPHAAIHRWDVSYEFLLKVMSIPGTLGDRMRESQIQEIWKIASSCGCGNAGHEEGEQLVCIDFFLLCAHIARDAAGRSSWFLPFLSFQTHGKPIFQFQFSKHTGSDSGIFVDGRQNIARMQCSIWRAWERKKRGKY